MANLTTVGAVKEYLGITANQQDALIATLIPRATSQIEKYCGRRFPYVSFADKKMNGQGTARLVLPANPVLSVSALQIGPSAVSASADGMVQAGYAYDEYSVYLIGAANGGWTRFPLGLNNVKVSFTAGYQSSESDFVPTGNTPTLTPSTDGNAATDISVTYTANGVALTQTGNNPLVGQYSFNAPTYTFNSADYNREVTMSYYYVPQSVEQACCELVGLKLKQRTNIGVKSQGLASESVTYEDRDMTPSIKQMLTSYVLRVFT